MAAIESPEWSVASLQPWSGMSLSSCKIYLRGVYRTLLREARVEIAGALTIIFVSPLDTSKVPMDWRVFKEGSREK